MANEPQREMEKELLGYKQRRGEQAGAPLELHPATRRMLQGEVARTARRPLLSSEEAAKNFVRSFVMSHQQAGFFARHKHRLIWWGAMCACLAVVLAVLRNDPRQQEQARTFSDSLPAPPAAPAPEAARLEVQREHLARAVKLPPVPEGRAGLSPVPAASAPGMRLPVQRETERRSDTAARPLPALSATPANASGGSAPVSAPAKNRSLAETTMERGVALDAAKLAAETRAPALAAPLAKALKAEAAPSVALAPVVLKRAEAASAAPATPMTATTVPLSAAASGQGAPTQQRFQQLDDRAQYRQNFNSPPVPQVLQQFAFERIGDRVRIVDGDGSAYEGSVLPELAEAATRMKRLAAGDDQRDRKDQLLRKAQPGDPVESYRFVASGLNRKLNQSVEFRGQWQPSVAPPAGAAPGAFAADSVSSRLAMQTAVKQAKASAITYTAPAGPAPTQRLPSGRISGRAVVGGKNEFDINAVPQ